MFANGFSFACRLECGVGTKFGYPLGCFMNGSYGFVPSESNPSDDPTFKLFAQSMKSNFEPMLVRLRSLLTELEDARASDIFAFGSIFSRGNLPPTPYMIKFRLNERPKALGLCM